MSTGRFISCRDSILERKQAVLTLLLNKLLLIEAELNVTCNEIKRAVSVFDTTLKKHMSMVKVLDLPTLA
jgi:hypothetical protein